MAGRKETPLDQGVFDKTLETELAKGTDRRVAEGRARAAGVRAYRAAHPEETQAAAAPPAGGNGGDGQAAAPAAAAARPAAAAAAAAPAAPAAAVAAPGRTAPAPTGKPPVAKQGAPDKHRLLALVPPEGIQRVER